MKWRMSDRQAGLAAGEAAGPSASCVCRFLLKLRSLDRYHGRRASRPSGPRMDEARRRTRVGGRHLASEFCTPLAEAAGDVHVIQCPGGGNNFVDSPHDCLLFVRLWSFLLRLLQLRRGSGAQPAGRAICAGVSQVWAGGIGTIWPTSNCGHKENIEKVWRPNGRGFCFCPRPVTVVGASRGVKRDDHLAFAALLVCGWRALPSRTFG